MSEILLSQIDKNLLRLEAEYYQNKFLTLQKSIELFEDFKDFAKRIECGPFGSNLLDNEYKEEGVLVVRPFNLKNCIVENENLVFISEEAVAQNSLKLYSYGTMLFSRVGDIKIGVLNKKIATISPNIIAVEFDDLKISKFFSVFFNTKYGYPQIFRELKVSAQPTISTSIIKDLKVPKFKNIDKKVIELFEFSEEKLDKSKCVYAEAESLLLEELNLTNFQPNEQGVNVKSLKDSFLTSGRLDAEYYQPKFDVIEQAFNQFERIKLCDLVDYPISSGITPKAGGSAYTDENEGIPFVRAVDLQDGRVQNHNFNYIKSYVHDGVLKRTQLKKNDVLFSIAGTVGRTALFTHDFDANINQAVAILRFSEEKVIREYLVAFFNTFIGKEFISKYSRQGLQTNLNLTEVGSLSVPIIDYDKQQQIAELIQQSFALKSQSEQLLDDAKKLVEMAIEEGEERALAWYQSASVFANSHDE